ncbi:unnamed protein product [Phytophthora fragariaefolia]|uniref:Unnamed protein product n=1 Tax=Phytophthora fragariaefolia TaxID=1490495 RepID=A0A9W6TJC8_9STRA|nr:unnamed protein product [Phytophthora fragariaefolia]
MWCFRRSRAHSDLSRSSLGQSQVSRQRRGHRPPADTTMTPRRVPRARRVPDRPRVAAGLGRRHRRRVVDARRREVLNHAKQQQVGGDVESPAPQFKNPVAIQCASSPRPPATSWGSSSSTRGSRCAASRPRRSTCSSTSCSAIPTDTGTAPAHVTKEGRTYYYNRATKQSAWEKPADFDGEEPGAAPAAARKAEWEELWDPKNERAYYYNRVTRKTQWQRPEGVEIRPHAGEKKHRGKARKAEENGITGTGENGTTGTGENGSTDAGETQTQNGEDAKPVEHETEQGQEVTVAAAAGGGGSHSRKKKKKSKREKNEAAPVESQRKRRRHDEKRLIIWDDEEQNDTTKDIEEKDTEDGKEATRLLHDLSKTDAIMEANVLAVINGFLRAHTESNGPEILVEKLSSSYRGHAQMIGLVASWLDTLPVSTTALENKMTFDVSEGAVIANKGASWDPAEEILYSHLKDVINENYDPKLVSNVLSGSAVEPEWLTQMLSDRKWRLMLIELAETHKVCVHDAWQHKGMRLLTMLCGAVFRHSSHSYVYAQELLCSMDDKLYLMLKDAGTESAEYTHIRMVRSKLNRVRGELQETASSRFGAKIVPFHILRRRYIYDANPKFCDAILSIVKSKKCSELSAETLAKEFQTSKTPPPVAHLRDPMVRLLYVVICCLDYWLSNSCCQL